MMISSPIASLLEIAMLLPMQTSLNISLAAAPSKEIRWTYELMIHQAYTTLFFTTLKESNITMMTTGMISITIHTKFEQIPESCNRGKRCMSKVGVNILLLNEHYGRVNIWKINGDAAWPDSLDLPFIKVSGCD